MRREELRAGSPLDAGEFTIVPIERWVIQAADGDMGWWSAGLKEAIAIVVCDEAGLRAFDTQAGELAVAALIQQVPELETVLASRAR